MLDGLQQESDMAANLILDAAILANTLIVEEGEGVRSPLDVDDLQVGLNVFKVNAKAGEGFAVHPLAPNVQSGVFPARDVIDSMASDATAASETLIGNVSKSGTTAFETNQAMVAGARRLKVGVTRIREAVWRTQSVLHTLCVQQYALKSGGDPEYKIPYPTRQGAATKYMDMTLAEFISPVRFFLLGDGINTDKGLQLQAAEKLYLMAERSPFIMGNMERLYAISADFLSAYGKKDYLNFIGSVDEAKKMDADAAEKAQDPKTTIPQIESNANPESIAAILLKAAPEVVPQYIELLGALYAAAESGKAQAEQGAAEQEKAALELKLKQQAAQSDIEKTQMQMKFELEIGKLQLDAQLKEAQASQDAAIKQSRAAHTINQTKLDAADKLAAEKAKQSQSKASDSQTKK
jgi:hypothetical protein